MTVWTFASTPPETGSEWTDEHGRRQSLDPLTECPPLRYGMVNAELLAAYELCRVARDEAAARVDLWEFWAGTEREAHQRLKGK